MILMGVKRKINPQFKLAGDGLGAPSLEKLEGILRKNPKIFFL